MTQENAVFFSEQSMGLCLKAVSFDGIGVCRFASIKRKPSSVR